VSAILLLLALEQPAAAADPGAWKPDRLPVHLATTSRVLGPVLPHGPDTSSGEDVPAGGFKYIQKKKPPVFTYVGSGLGLFGLLYLGGARTASFEAADAPTSAARKASLAEQATKRTVGFTLLGTAGACLVVDIFI
jgi:hypothetical protein